MRQKMNWLASAHDSTLRVELPSNVTLYVSPDHTTHFGTKPRRGTTWRAGASQWDGKSTINRFGRDIYGILHPNKQAAMAAAEQIYREAMA